MVNLENFGLKAVSFSFVDIDIGILEGQGLAYSCKDKLMLKVAL